MWFLTFLPAILYLEQWLNPRDDFYNNPSQVIDLSVPGWTLTSENGSISVPANVPSHQYIDLYNASIIPDPLFGSNSNELAWARDQNWTYSRSLSVIVPRSHKTSTLLVFKGLDTFTTITLCGRHIANTENQFRQYIFNVSDTLLSCKDDLELSLNFGPALPITHELSEGPNRDELASLGAGCNENPGNEFSCKIYARKQNNDFGWDWSPSLIPAGPWRGIYAVQMAAHSVYVNNALIDIYRKGQMNNIPPDQSQPWIFNTSIDCTGTLPTDAKLRLTLSDFNGTQILQQDLEGVYSSRETITGSINMEPDLVQLWWPNGLGQQQLYTAKVDIIIGTVAGTSRPVIAATVERRVGFRTIVLNLQPISDAQLAAGVAPGSNWHFEINGHEFYVKGSNFIPPDVFWPRVDETKIRTLFTLAKDANMNMLRVWSSGAYLDDWIYDIADEMGLLLWSEFQFSDTSYPTTDHYFAEYEAEADYNVRRLNHHPSLALWAGGNELETVMLTYFFGGDLFYGYQRTNEELLLKCVFTNSRSISYIPSSTYNGYLDLDVTSTHPMTGRYKNTSGEGYYYADTDSYAYFAPNIFDFDQYPKGRFANEFGFPSIPSIQSWRESAPVEDLYYPSETIIAHNRHYVYFGFDTDRERSLAGIQHMTDAVQLYLPSPNLSNSQANFSAWCYSTQIIQAEAMVHQIAYYRRGSAMPERQLGSLYWMFNDVWDAPTWSGIEASGRQKMLHYAAKDIYSPVIVYAFYDRHTTALEVWVISDLWHAVSGTLSYKWTDWNGNSLDIEGILPFAIEPINATLVLSYPELLPDMTNALLFLSITTNSTKNSHSSVFHPTALREIDLPDPGLTLVRTAGNVWTVKATQAVAAWVWLEYDTNDVLGYWSDNGFWLDRNESKEVTFTVLKDDTGGKWVEGVSVRSVWDNTEHS